MEIIKCPDCGSVMHSAMIDIDGTTLDEGFECQECENILIQGSPLLKGVSYITEGDQFVIDNKPVTLISLYRREGIVRFEDGIEVSTRNHILIDLKRYEEGDILEHQHMEFRGDELPDIMEDGNKKLKDFEYQSVKIFVHGEEKCLDDVEIVFSTKDEEDE